MSRKKYPDLPGSAIVGLKVEHEPTTTPGQLAIELAESMQNAINYRADAVAFREHSVFEAGKIRKLNTVLFQLKERERNPPEKISRMDPLGEYNLDMINEEIALAKARTKEFSDRASSRETEASAEDNKAVRLQREIRELNESLKKRA
jgi:hypothetical protein